MDKIPFAIQVNPHRAIAGSAGFGGHFKILPTKNSDTLGTVGDIKTNSTRMRSTWLPRYQIKRVMNVSFLSYVPL